MSPAEGSTSAAPAGPAQAGDRSVDRPGRGAAGLYESAEGWMLAIATVSSGGWAVELSGLPAGDGPSVAAALARRRITRLVRVAPAADTIVRTTPVRGVAEADLSAALDLIAEAQLPPTVPAHRRSAGLAPVSAAPVSAAPVSAASGGAALACGWLPRGGGVTAITRGGDERWTTVPAALSALLARAGGLEPGESVSWSDGQARCVMSRGEKFVARLGRPGPGFAAETLAAAGGQAAGVPIPDDAGFWVSPRVGRSIAGRVRGLPDKAALSPGVVVAVGAALMGLEAPPADGSLASLSAEAPADRVPVATRVLVWLTRPRRAIAACAVSAAVMLLAPAGIAAGRLAILESKAKELDRQRGSRDALARRAALYEHLSASRWPMTKLLADISGAAPVGVEILTLRLSRDQGLLVSGVASEQALLNALQANLNRTGLFRAVTIDRSEQDASARVSFDVSAELASPHLFVQPAEDFAARSLAVRLYGEGASNTAYHAASAPPRRPTRDDEGDSSRGSGDDEENSSAPRPPSRPSGGVPSAPPRPLTDAEIAAMPWMPDAMKAWGERQSYLRANADLDPAIKQRLQAEVDKLLARKSAAPAGGSP